MRLIPVELEFVDVYLKSDYKFSRQNYKCVSMVSLEITYFDPIESKLVAII